MSDSYHVTDWSGTCWDLHSKALYFDDYSLGILNAIEGGLAVITFIVLLSIVYRNNRLDRPNLNDPHSIGKRNISGGGEEEKNDKKKNQMIDRRKEGELIKDGPADDAMHYTAMADNTDEEGLPPSVSASGPAVSAASTTSVVPLSPSASSSSSSSSRPLAFSSYVRFLHVCALWAVSWAIFKFTHRLPSNPSTEYFHAISGTIVHSVSLFLEVSVAIFLLTDSIGTRAFLTAATVSSFLAVIHAALYIFFTLPALNDVSSVYSTDQLDYLMNDDFFIFNMVISGLLILFFGFAFLIGMWKRIESYRARIWREQRKKRYAGSGNSARRKKADRKNKSRKNSIVPHSNSQSKVNQLFSVASTTIGPRHENVPEDISPSSSSISLTNQVSAAIKQPEIDETPVIPAATPVITTTSRSTSSSARPSRAASAATSASSSFSVSSPPSLSLNSPPPRHALTIYSLFLCIFYCFKLSSMYLLYENEDMGVCIYDFSQCLYIFFYASILYFTLITDSAYWHDLLLIVFVKGEMDKRSAIIIGPSANQALTNAWQDYTEQQHKWMGKDDKSQQSSASTSSATVLPQQHHGGGVVATAGIIPLGNNSPSSQRRAQSGSRSSREYSRSFSEDLGHQLEFDDVHNNAAPIDADVDNKEGVTEEDEDEDEEHITIDIGTYQPSEESLENGSTEADTEPGAEGSPYQQQTQTQQQTPHVDDQQQRQEQIVAQLAHEDQKGLTRMQRASDRTSAIPLVSGTTSNVLTPASSTSSLASDFSSASVASSTASLKLWSQQSAYTNLQSLLIPSHHLTFVRYLISPGKRWKKQKQITPSSSPSSILTSSMTSVSTLSLCNYHGTLVVVKRFSVSNLTSSFLSSTFAAFIHHLASISWVKPQSSTIGEDDLDDTSRKNNKKEQTAEYIRNDHMIQLYGICLDPPDLSLVLEYGVNGCLYDYLHRAEENKRRAMTHRKGHVSFDVEPGSQSSSATSGDPRGSVTLPLDSFDPLVAALQIAEGMMHLHSQSNYESHPITLKSANIVLDEQYNAKICDLSEDTYFRSRHSRRILSPFSAAWIAPEMLAGFKQTRSADVYAFGIILWELLTYRLPFVQVPVKQATRQYHHGGHHYSPISNTHHILHSPQQPIAIGEGNIVQKKKVTIKNQPDAKSPLLGDPYMASTSSLPSQGETTPMIPTPSSSSSSSSSSSPYQSSYSAGYQSILLRSLKLCQQHILLDRLRPPIPRHCPGWLSRLLNQCWDESAEERPTFAVIVSFMQQQLKTQTRITLPLTAL